MNREQHENDLDSYQGCTGSSTVNDGSEPNIATIFNATSLEELMIDTVHSKIKQQNTEENTLVFNQKT